MSSPQITSQQQQQPSPPLSTSVSFSVPLSPFPIIYLLLNFFYILLQRLIVLGFKPPVPPNGVQWHESAQDAQGDVEEGEEEVMVVKPYGRIAVVGAGLTGVSSAAHLISHGFLPTIYESSPGPIPGGIWNNANASSSSLQFNSILYRFHPAVVWKRAYPKRDEILAEIRRIWREYQLEARTRFNTPVTSITRVPSSTNTDTTKSLSKWIINDGADGVFDAVIVTVGTCGKPRWIKLPGMPDDIGSVERFEVPPVQVQVKNKEKYVGGDKYPGHSKQELRDDKDKDRYEQEQEQEHTDQPKNNHVKKRRQKQDQDRQDEHKHEHEHEHGSSYSHSDVGRESVVSSSSTAAGGGGATLSRTKRTSEGPRGRKRNGRKEMQSSGHRWEWERDEDDEYRRQAKPQVEEKSDIIVTISRDDNNTFLRGPIVHSSQLDALSPVLLKGKKVVVIGNGASAVEAVETALERGCEGCFVLARHDKWIIPRNMLFDTLIAVQPFGRRMPLSFIWEYFLLKTQYKGVEDLIPRQPIFSGSPIVNDEFLPHVRAGRCKYIRCDPVRLTKKGVLVIERGKGDDDGEETERLVEADVIVLATGFERPDIGFLEEGLFPERYERPNLYLQNFSTEGWTILMTDSAYENAIGTIGHVHIGIYTRILLTFLLYENARPTPKAMKSWVDVVRFLKRGASGGASFFTYAEITIWLLLFYLFRPDRIKWIFFIMNGWGVHPQKAKMKKRI